ncbi:MAG: hypothetical protein OEV30_12860, partial [Ignavibacteria bacterium]|nr:hypothetical protein [Ignavibacteria bacterium]
MKEPRNTSPETVVKEIRRRTRRKISTLRQGAVLLFLLGVVFHSSGHAQLLGERFQRVTQRSNFEFAVLNFGMLWGDHLSRSVVANWPRGRIGLIPYPSIAGPLFLAKSGSRFLASDAGFIRQSPTGFHHMVPGRVGDINAGLDPEFGGNGWRYVDDPDYIVFSSLDYDDSGVDLSGVNFNDWPLRYVNGIEVYVVDPNDRRQYSPVFRSDEDLFCVYKDTDTRADAIYSGPFGPSIPMGIEIRQYVHSWGESPGSDIVVIRYQVLNKGDDSLDSCYFAYGAGLSMGNRNPGRPEDVLVPKSIWADTVNEWRNLAVVQPISPDLWQRTWLASAVPPTVGYTFLEAPLGYDSTRLGLNFAVVDYEVNWFRGQDGVARFISDTSATDSIV